VLALNIKANNSGSRKGKRHLLSWALIGLLAIIVFNACGQTIADNPQNQDVLAVLKRFQAGYDNRDIPKVDEYVRDLFDSDVLVIGTRAYASGDGEWCEGIEKVKELVAWDWQYWDDLRMETEKARIRIDGNTAWVAFWGTLVSLQTKEKGYSVGMKNILKRQKENKYKENPREFFLWLSNYSSRVVWDFERTGGEEFIHPIRITAVLYNRNGKWLFKQMHFSYPTGYHKTRIIKGQDDNR
jgi:hypothetical protein